MSAIDDLQKYIDSDLAKTNEYNRNLRLAGETFLESSVAALIQTGIDWLEEKKKINSTEARALKTAVTVVDFFVKFCINVSGFR